MPKVKVKNLKNEEVGEMDLKDSIFAAEVNMSLLHEIVRMQRAKKRSGTACVKERNAVIGTGAKPYRQKGTGRARQGSLKSPNHVGGGVVFGPRPRSYDFTPPKKVRKGAMISSLSLFFNEERLTVLENFNMAEIKTQKLVKVLTKLGASHSLIVDDVENEKLKLSAQNLARHRFLPPEGLNVYDLLSHDQLLITKRAVEKLVARLDTPARKGAAR